MRFAPVFVLLALTTACDADELSIVEPPPPMDPADPSDPVDPTDPAPQPCNDRQATRDLAPTDRSTQIFTGNEPEAIGGGSFYARGPSGEELRGPVALDGPAGNYAVEIPLFCGAQTISIEFPIQDGCTTTTEYRLTRTACSSVDIQVTVSWDALGRDWELHLIQPRGAINDNLTDCTWTSCIPTGPDWGVTGDASDNPAKDVDNTGNFGPENITLSRPINGVFTVLIEHWGSGDPSSDGEVTINAAGTTTVIPILNLPPQFVREAARIDWPSGQVTPLSTLHDCTANWSAGCRDRLPN